MSKKKYVDWDRYNRGEEGMMQWRLLVDWRIDEIKRRLDKLEHPDPAPERMTATEAVIMDDYKRHREIYKKFIKDPAPPLKARVAKALGYKVIRRQNGEWSMPRSSMEQEYIEYVPPYDEDVKLAIGALEEYCRTSDLQLYWRIWTCYTPDAHYSIEITNQELTKRTGALWGKSLARAICEAIVKHSEGING
jgi:hypothetical protein